MGRFSLVLRMLRCMSGAYPRDQLTRGLARSADGRVLVNFDTSVPWDVERTDDDQATRGLLRDADGALLVEATGGVVAGLFVDQDGLAAMGLKLEVSFARDEAGDPVLEPDGSVAIENIRIVASA
jgi:hypothetical protein